GKWKHQSGGKASEAVFALHHERVQQAIARCQAVIVTESPLDAATLLAASKWTNLPAISVLGKGNAKALSADLHRQVLSDTIGDSGTIFVWQEPDADGFAQAVADALQRPVKAIFAPDTERKDAWRLWLVLNKDWNAFAQAIRDLVAQAIEVTPQQTTQGRRLPNAAWIPLREITRPDPNEQWQVEGLIKAGNLVILSARPKTAKSIVGLNLAACVATGRPFLNRPTQQGRALFVAWERHDLTVQRAFAMGLDACEDFMIWDRHRFGVAPRVDALDWWREFITTNNIRLVVFDTLAHFLRPELDKVRNALNAYDYIGGVLEQVVQVANETGCTFVLIHHDRKGEGDADEQRVLGTTALTAAADIVLQLQPLSDDVGVTALKATGNAIDDQTLYFAIQPDFWLAPTERPAVTKEEKAANAIAGYLRLHGEAKRKELERHLQEIGLAESHSAAEKLFDRAVVVLQGKVVRTQRGIYILQSDLKHPDDTIENVYVVENSEPNSDTPDIPDMSEMSEMSETSHRFPTKPTTRMMSSESRNGHDWHRDLLASDTPILPDLLIPENPTTPCHYDRTLSKNDVHRPSFPELPTNTPKPTELAYASPRGDEPVNAPITETSNPTSSDEVRYIDTEQWLDELCAELSEASNKPPDDTSSASQQKPDRLACLCGGELRLFGKTYECLRCDSPRIAACRYCGKALQLTSDSHAECVGCGVSYTFDRARRLWLSDFDAF
ncbi:MAG: AAA family ATPase, partial [Armatimonadota bacterium]